MNTSTQPAAPVHWIFAAAGLAAASGLLFAAVPAQFGGVVAICQQAASRLMTLPDDFTQQFIIGLLFFAATVFQWMSAALLLAKRADLPRALVLAALSWNGAVLALWVAARLAGAFWPDLASEPVSVIEFAARCIDVALAACLVVLWREVRVAPRLQSNPTQFEG